MTDGEFLISWAKVNEGNCRWKKVTHKGFLGSGALAVAATFIPAVLGEGRGKMLSPLTLGHPCAEKAGDVRGRGTGSPETVCFELSLVGHVTSLSQFLPL